MSSQPHPPQEAKVPPDRIGWSKCRTSRVLYVETSDSIVQPRGFTGGTDTTNLLSWKTQKWLIRRAEERQEAIKAWQIKYGVSYNEVAHLVETDWLSEEEVKNCGIPEEYRDEKIDEETAEKISPAATFGDGGKSKEELEKEIEGRLQEMANKTINEFGYEGDQAIKMRNLIMDKGRTCGRIRMHVDDIPAKLNPMKVVLANNSIPDHFKFHRYPPAQRKALMEATADLLERGLIRENSKSRWLSRMLVIPKPRKPGEEIKYRFVIDLRSINSKVIPLQLPMTNVMEKLPYCANKKVFISCDFQNGFWQLPLDEESQDFISFPIGDKVYSYTRAPQGYIDSAGVFQQEIVRTFQELVDKNMIIIYIDDILALATNFEEHYYVLNVILSKCNEVGLKLNLNKSDFGAKQAEFLGRIINEKGYQLHPRSTKAIEEMNRPETIGELGQFIHGVNWVRESIPGLTELMTPLREVLEAAYTKVGTRKKGKSMKLNVSDYGWTEKHDIQFDLVKKAFILRIQQAFYNEGWETCVITDASEGFWGGFITQVEHWDDSKPVWEQKHNIIAVFSGAFDTSQMRWSTSERESYPIVQAFTKFDYYLSGNKGVRLFTDHTNVLSFLKGERGDLSRVAFDKVQRWLTLLAHYKIKQVVHIAGDKNVFADALSRWMHPQWGEFLKYKETLINVKYVGGSYEFHGRDYDAFAKTNVWPDMEEIRINQGLNEEEVKDISDMEKSGVYYKSVRIDKEEREAIVLSIGDRDLIYRLLVIAHCCSMGHRSKKVTLDVLRRRFYWKGMKEDVSNFCKGCLNCLKSKSGDTVPRPYGVHMFAKERGEIISMDYMYIASPGKDCDHEYKYCLVIKDEFSGLVYIAPTKRADADSAIEILSFYMSFTRVPKVIMSDGGRHFVNQTIDGACELLGIKHHITTPYMSFSNGSVERVNRELKALLQLVQRGTGITWEKWPSFLPYVMQVINGTKAERLGSKTPKEIYMGIHADDPFEFIFDDEKKEFRKISVDEREYEASLGKLLEELELLHKPLHELKEKTQDRNNKYLIRSKLLGKRKSRNADTGLEHREYADEDLNVHDYFTDKELRKMKIMFQVGDFVLVAEPEKRMANKLISRWNGPLRIVEEVHPWIYLVENLSTGVNKLVHATRMKFYCDADLDVTVELKDLVNKDGNWKNEYRVHEIVGHKFDVDSLEWKLRVRWEGFSEEENTDESFERMFEDVPKFVEEYVRRLVANKSEDANILATLFKDISGSDIKTSVVNSKKRKR